MGQYYGPRAWYGFVALSPCRAKNVPWHFCFKLNKRANSSTYHYFRLPGTTHKISVRSCQLLYTYNITKTALPLLPLAVSFCGYQAIARTRSGVSGAREAGSQAWCAEPCFAACEVSDPLCVSIVASMNVSPASLVALLAATYARQLLMICSELDHITTKCRWDPRAEKPIAYVTLRTLARPGHPTQTRLSISTNNPRFVRYYVGGARS